MDPVQSGKWGKLLEVGEHGVRGALARKAYSDLAAGSRA
jgi:hypothetical protein